MVPVDTHHQALPGRGPGQVLREPSRGRVLAWDPGEGPDMGPGGSYAERVGKNPPGQEERLVPSPGTGGGLAPGP